MRKVTISMLGLLLLSTILFSTAAFAHVVVYPREATQGSYEKFTVRVPTEKESPTVQVEVKIPDDVNISRFEPKPDWTYEIEKDESGKIVSVTWKATGAGLSATEFGEFHMQGKVADDAKDLVWRAYQTYSDGDVVEWIGAEDSDKPASITAVKAKIANTGGATNTAADQGNTSTALYLSIAALILGLISIMMSFMKRAK